MNQIKTILLVSVFILFFLPNLYSQSTEAAKDTVKYSYWLTKFSPGVRVGAGYSGTLFTELGFSLHRLGGDIINSPSANCFYSSFEWIPKVLPEKEENIYGFKTGFELSGNLTLGAIELKYQTNTKQNDFVITPKLGLGLWGYINLLYGYNISTKSYPFASSVGRHQFSLVCNIPIWERKN